MRVVRRFFYTSQLHPRGIVRWSLHCRTEAHEKALLSFFLPTTAKQRAGGNRPVFVGPRERYQHQHQHQIPTIGADLGSRYPVTTDHRLTDYLRPCLFRVIRVGVCFVCLRTYKILCLCVCVCECVAYQLVE
ncbi:unnamed protein product [Protopolystoma xenopodis]|uniref:Uncharacterized protein n=1 Tax=Protopolystoma xenopodis TaxID=117903 RepID=A0A448WE49_9PLAT|nr:unnamed protein product [Protopolystoma xenopodis]